MKYICTDDIEILAAQGKRELVVDEFTVLMDLARDLARQLGIVIVDDTHPAPNKAASVPASSSPAKTTTPAVPTPAPTSSARSVAPALGAKPRGCQHGPLPVAARVEQPKTNPGTDGVVEQLVELVRQSASNRSGN